MSHLGDRLTAFVDAELPHDARENVLAHLAGCGDCRAAADAERAVKARLAALDGVRPSDDLIRRLHALAEPGEPLPPRRPLIDASPRPPAVPVGEWKVPGPPAGGGAPVGRPPAARLPRRSHVRLPATFRRRQRLHAVAAGVGVAAMALGAAVAFGGQPQPGPAVSPADDWFAVEHAASTGGLPLADPAMSMTVGFAAVSGAMTGGGTSLGSGGTTGAPASGAYFGVSQR